MELPEEFLQSLSTVKGFDRSAFVKVHEDKKEITSIRLNPAKWMRPPEELYLSWKEQRLPPPVMEHVPWAGSGYYLSERPSFTFDPLFQAGCYYVQEASGMFLEQVFIQLADLSKPLKVLDLCGAPGGKSTHIQSLISPLSLLVSNEFIRNRCTILKDNIIKWGACNVFVTNQEPKAFAHLPGFFDVIVADAPCSGSGLFRKDPDSISHWSQHSVRLCSQRQQKILADVLPSLKENGLLIYSTCSYSREENELIADWLTAHGVMENISICFPEGWNIITSETSSGAGYRFYPDKIKGEGFFIACFRKTATSGKVKYKKQRPVLSTTKEKAIIMPWLKDKADVEIIKEGDSSFAIPVTLVNDASLISSLIPVFYRGTAIGKIIKNKLVPEHAFALSPLLEPDRGCVDMDYEESIKYLQRKEVSVNISRLGWQPACYRNQNLGWLNVLTNRINNYYPREIRILKESLN